MKVLQNPIIAVILVIVMIALSTTVGASISLYGDLDALQAIYENDTDGSGRGVAAYSMDMIDACRNMIKLAERYNGSEELAGVVQTCLAEVDRHTGPDHARWQALQALYTAAGELDLQLFNSALSEQDKTMLDKLVADIDSTYHIIDRKRESYNQAVIDFNGKLDAFPANILSDIIGIRPVEAFA